MTKKKTMQMNRKTATKLLMIQWSRFQRLCVNLEGSTLFTGVNGTGKSTILDAMTYLLTGNTQFNKAAKDRDRTVLSYVRGDTKSNGPSRYLRSGEVISYLAMEFWSPVENCFLVVGVCVESANETAQKSSWFVCRDTRMDQINFTKTEGKLLLITPKNELSVNGHVIKSAAFWGRDRGVEQILRALGLRCQAGKYRSKLLKMMAFNPENNIDQFIQECVLEAGKIESLKELREQRRQFEQIKCIYENLRDSKGKLEEVEKKSREYENKQRSLHTRELMLCYQELQSMREEEANIRSRLETLNQREKALKEKKNRMDGLYEAAGERYRIAMSNDMFKGMKESLNELERQKKELEKEIRQKEESLAVLKDLQIRIGKILKWLDAFADISKEEEGCLCNLAEEHVQTDRKIDAFVRFKTLAEGQDKIFEQEEVHTEDRIKELNTEIGDLEEKIKRLKSNIMVYPKKIETAKRIIQKELEAQGIHTEVRIFAELVQEVTDAKWRAALETFLGRKRFYIIVDGKHCHKAMEVLQKKKLYAANVVVSDKLPDTQVIPGSAAEILKIPNPYARRFANYLLNGIHLCDSLEELHEYPKGGLMADGMLAKSYAVSCMDMNKTEFCLGQDAIQHQLLKASEEKREKTEERGRQNKHKDQICQWRKELKEVDWKTEHYDFGAASALADMSGQKTNICSNIEKIRSNPDFMAVLQEQENAKREYERLERAKEELAGELGGCAKEQEAEEKSLKKTAGDIYVSQKKYEDKRIRHMELEKVMLEEYEKLRAKKGSWQVITFKTVQNLKSELEDCARQLENVQLAYCKLAEIDINKRGISYIPFFREEYRNIANIKIEEARQRLDEQSVKLENAFVNDFVAEINETISESKAEIAEINRELKQLPFGNDTYKFVMKEKSDRNIFFRICKRLENYMTTPEVYMNSARDDEEMERDIQDFMEIILDEEDETEYTDYRKYFVYDMEIVSRQGDDEIVSDLSKKQGSASNGEKQTPYFIILAASLLQCYPRQTCCARLAFIDEAFSALSRERIEQMVKYLEDNHFQVFYAAPPEKINSIGSYIDSTVSLVTTGKYTNAVEGLVKKYESGI